MGKASASEARGPGFEPPCLVQRSRWESRPLSLVGNGAGAVTHPIDRAGTVLPRGTGRFVVKKGVHIASFRCLSEETLNLFLSLLRGGQLEGHERMVDVRKYTMFKFEKRLLQNRREESGHGQDPKPSAN